MSQSLRHLHMGCGESLMAAWSTLRKASPKTGRKKEALKDDERLARAKKVKGAC